MPAKVREFFRQFVEFVRVEDFSERTRAVPVGNLALAVLCEQFVENLRTKRSHACAAADVDHFRIGFLVDEELAVRAGNGNFVARLETENVAGHKSRGNVGHSRGRGRDSDVEHDNALFRRVRRHRVRARYVFRTG